MGANVVFILAVIGWVGVTSAILFLGLKFTVGIRVPEADEVRWIYTSPVFFICFKNFPLCLLSVICSKIMRSD